MRVREDASEEKEDRAASAAVAMPTRSLCAGVIRPRTTLIPSMPPSLSGGEPQVRAMGDLKVTKFGGFWGQKSEESSDRSFSAPLGEVEFLVERAKTLYRQPPSSERS